MVRVDVAKRRPPHDDVAVLKEQAGARVLQLRVERQRAAVAAVASASDLGVNNDRSAELLRAGDRIDRVEPLKEAGVRVEGINAIVLGGDIEDVVRAPVDRDA